MDASWTLRRLIDKNSFHGADSTMYVVCEVMQRAAVDVAAMDDGLRRSMLALAQSVHTAARLDREKVDELR